MSICRSVQTSKLRSTLRQIAAFSPETIGHAIDLSTEVQRVPPQPNLGKTYRSLAYVSIYQPAYPPSYISIYLPTYLSIYLPFYLSIYVPICTFIYSSMHHLPIYLSTFLPSSIIYLPTYLLLYLSTYVPT